MFLRVLVCRKVCKAESELFKGIVISKVRERYVLFSWLSFKGTKLFYYHLLTSPPQIFISKGPVLYLILLPKQITIIKLDLLKLVPYSNQQSLSRAKRFHERNGHPISE